MNEHLAFEDIVEFIFLDKMDAGYMEMAAKMNAHIYSCEKCRHLYLSILSIHDVVESKVIVSKLENTESYRILYALRMFCKRKGINEDGMKELIANVKGINEFISLHIPTLSKICAINTQKTFWHPAYAMVEKADRIWENAREVEDASALVDDYSNRISVEEDGTLSLILNQDECSASSIVLLIPYDRQEYILISKPRKFDGELVKVDFDNVIPGDYYIKILF